MTNTELIRQEIERLIKVNKELTPRDFTQGIASGYADVLSFIDSLPKESEKGMKWRTDTPTANVIVALVRYNDDSANGLQITSYDFRVLEKKADDFYIDFHSDREHIPTERITKWADLEEDETVTKSNQHIERTIYGIIHSYWDSSSFSPDDVELYTKKEERDKSYERQRQTPLVKRGDAYLYTFETIIEEDETVTDIELIQKSWYRQGYIDGINKQEPQWILENLEYKENPKYGQPLETVTDCHQLEEAARNSWFNYEFDCGALYSKCYKDGFKAGAGWQREQFHDACYQCEKAYDSVFYRGEQHAIKMLKEEAIEGKCIDIGMAGVVIDTDYGCLFLPQNTFKIGDKVKVIILKDGNED